MKSEALKSIIGEAQTRFKLYRDVFGTKSGQLLLSYMDHLYSGKPDLTNDNITYHNLGKREVINQIKAILDKESK